MNGRRNIFTLAVPVSADGRKTAFVQRLVKGHSQSL